MNDGSLVAHRRDGLLQVLHQTVDLVGNFSQVFLLPGLRQITHVTAGVGFVDHPGWIVVELDGFSSKTIGNNGSLQFHVARVVPDPVDPRKTCPRSKDDLRPACVNGKLVEAKD